MQFEHLQNSRGGEFFYNDLNGQRLAEISYQWKDQTHIIADHTWVDDALRGQGVARQLLDALVNFAREKHLKIVPICSYVEVMFRRDSNLNDVRA